MPVSELPDSELPGSDLRMPCPIDVRIIEGDFDPAAEAAALCDGRTDIGALVTFTGLCRDEQGALAALELEHYPGMAEAEITRVAQAATRRWPLLGVRIIHRYGKLVPGARIVLVMTASTHRANAFAAADFIMDFLKNRAPFWKKEHKPDGTAQDWVDAKEIDEQALKRWDQDI